MCVCVCVWISRCSGIMLPRLLLGVGYITTHCSAATQQRSSYHASVSRSSPDGRRHSHRTTSTLGGPCFELSLSHTHTEQPGWAGTRRNIHPLAPIVVHQSSLICLFHLTFIVNEQMLVLGFISSLLAERLAGWDEYLWNDVFHVTCNVEP